MYGHQNIAINYGTGDYVKVLLFSNNHKACVRINVIFAGSKWARIYGRRELFCSAFRFLVRLILAE